MKKVTIIDEFKSFIARGNMADFAIAVLMTTSFTKFINSLITYIISPFIMLLSGHGKLERLALTIDGIEIRYGPVIQSALNFCIMIIVVFFIVKTINAMQEKITGEHKVIKKEPTEQELLKGIKKDLKKKVQTIQVKPTTKHVSSHKRTSKEPKEKQKS